MNINKLEVILSTLPFYSFYNTKNEYKEIKIFRFLSSATKVIVSDEDISSVVNEPDENKVKELIPNLMIKGLSEVICSHNEDKVVNNFIDIHDKVLKRFIESTNWSFNIFDSIIEYYRSDDDLSLMRIYKYRSVLDEISPLLDRCINDPDLKPFKP